MIERILKLDKHIVAGKTLVLLGARRTGKTTLIKAFINDSDRLEIRDFNADRFEVRDNFLPENFSALEQELQNVDVLIIDEAQNIPNIGHTLKLLNDEMPNLIVVATGSSSFDLRGQTGEPLVGRKKTKILYPFSYSELKDHMTDSEFLRQSMIYGLYPNAVTENDDINKREFLVELVDSILLKDILAYKEIKAPEVLYKLLQLLAFQIGGLVSVNELSRKLQVHKDTVTRYLDLLEGNFIITKLTGYSSNLRKEVTKQSKYYFYDLGVRNALIHNFSELERRDDIGGLFENLMVIERLKRNQYEGGFAARHFLRTYEKAEIDYLEDEDGILTAYEFKYNANNPTKSSSNLQNQYNFENIRVVNSANYKGFLTISQI